MNTSTSKTTTQRARAVLLGPPGLLLLATLLATLLPALLPHHGW